MKIDTTDSRQSKYIVGILVITVFAVCVGILFGFGGNLKNKQNDYNLLNSSLSSDFTEDSSGKIFETVAQGMEMFDLDTAVGSIEGLGEWLPAWDVVPLCIDDALVAEYWITVKVIGGYEPYGTWVIDIYQDTKVDNQRELIGQIEMIYSLDTALSTCCYDVYRITFDVVGECIKVESNHFPDFPAGWVLTKEEICTPDLNKEVDIDISTYWFGCGEPYQRFELILFQKIVFPESPNSRM